VDPVTVATGLSVMSKVLGLGMKGWNALDDRSFDKDDVEGLRALVETAGGVVSSKAKASAKAPSAAATHLALVLRAFGQALGRHRELHGLVSLSTGWRRLFDGDEKAREKEIKLRMKLAAPRLTELGSGTEQELALLDSLQGSPLATPYYQALWWAFTAPGLTSEEAGELPPLDLTPTAAREFERTFLLAYLSGLAGGACHR
jgi:hypothetical protein